MIFEHKAIIRLQQPLQNTFILLSDYFTVYHADHSFITLDSVHIRYDMCIEVAVVASFHRIYRKKATTGIEYFNGIGISYLIRIEYAA